MAEVDEIERRYADLLGLIVAPRAETQPEAPEPARPRHAAAWLPLAAGLPLPLALLLVVLLGETPVLNVMLGLIFLSSLLLAAAVLPPAALTRARVPASIFARYRQPLALSAIGILVPVLLSAVLIPLI